MNPRTYRSRARFATDRPTKRKKRDYDATNDLAARVILADTRKHTRFQVCWARAFPSGFERGLLADFLERLHGQNGTQ